MTEPRAAHAPPHLSRVLGVVFGLAVVVGGVIGSGIMRAPGVVAQGLKSEPLILLAWAVMGGTTLLTAMPLVEAGASVPRAGGAYPIAERAFGRSAGFLTGWIDWLNYAASNAFIAVVFGEYVHRLGLAGGVSKGVLAIGLIAVVGLLNASGTRISGASQSVASAIKGGAFIILAAVLFLSPRAPVAVAAAPASLAHAAVAGGATLGAVIMAIRVIYQTYGGWNDAIYFSEEVRRPERNVARATFLGIGLVTVIYVLVNAAVLHVLTPAQIAGSQLAVGDAAKVSLGAAGDTVITAIGLFSLAAIVNVQIMAGSRITYRMAADGALPPLLAAVARGGAPWLSVILLVVASGMFAATGTYEGLVRIYTPWIIAVVLIVNLSAIRLRIAEPGLERPYRMPFFPGLAIAAALLQAGLIAVVVWDDPAAGLWSALVAVAPLPIYLVFAKAWRRQAERL